MSGWLITVLVIWAALVGGSLGYLLGNVAATEARIAADEESEDLD